MTPPTPPEPPTRTSRRAALLMVLGSLLLSMVVAELLLRWLHPMADPYARVKARANAAGPESPYVPSAFPPRYTMRTRSEPGLPGMEAADRAFSINNLGFRGDSLAIPKPAGEFRVFMVGGSTTECFYLDDREAVTARLQARLRAALPGRDVRVYGAGKSGDRSFDHVAMVAHRIAHLQPDLVIVFAGVNDMLPARGGRDYLAFPNPDDRDPLGMVDILELAATEFHLPRLVHAAFEKPQRSDIASLSQYGEFAAQARALPPATQPLPLDVAPYAENLRTLVAIGRAQGAGVVLMTQASTWGSTDPRASRWHWMIGRTERYPEAELAAALERYNETMREVGAQQSAPVFDLARGIPRSMDFFYDDVHFNVRGADTAAAMLTRFLTERSLVR